MNDKELKALTMSSLSSCLDNIYFCYSKIYDLYHSNEKVDRDAYFIHDLVDAIKGIEAVLEVYTRDNHINHGYASEKLNYSLSLIKYIKEYFDKKGSEEE